jgi:hypothetical protein
MDELPVQLLGLLRIKFLSALWALKDARHLDAHRASLDDPHSSKLEDFFGS